MIRTALLAGMLAAASLRPAGADPRIATHFYHDSDVVVVHGHTGIQSTIEFATDEHIENVAVGDSAAWQVVPNKRANLLFAKPLTAKGRTNMTVVTDERTYLFDLVSGPSTTAVYKLSFTYPPSPRPPEPKIAAAAVTQVAPKPPPAPMTAAFASTVATTPADLNFRWTSKGAKQLLPARSFDDGHSTYLSWPQGVALPAILVREASGTEGPVNYTVKGGYVVVDGVPGQIILRSGKQVATLTPDAKPAVPAPSPAAKRPPPPSLPMAGSVPTPIRLPNSESARR